MATMMPFHITQKEEKKQYHSNSEHSSGDSKYDEPSKMLKILLDEQFGFPDFLLKFIEAQKISIGDLEIYGLNISSLINCLEKIGTSNKVISDKTKKLKKCVDEHFFPKTQELSNIFSHSMVLTEVF